MPESVKISWEDATSEERDWWVHRNVFGLDGDVFPPRYTTDAAKDYLVLKHVMETWGRTQEDFAAAVICLGGRRCEWCHSLGYEPGDYSKAAYLAMTGGE